MDDFPTKDNKRSARRHSSTRMKNKAEKIAKHQWGTTPEVAKNFRKHADYIAVCSCYMCGNPRRVFKGGSGEKTLRERNFKVYYE